MREFGEWLAKEEWEEMEGVHEPNKKLDVFEEKINDKMDVIFPENSFKVSNQDRPFINWKLKKLKRKVQRLYRRKGRKEEYLKVLKEYQEQFSKASKEYIDTNVAELRETNPAKAADILKKLGGAPCDCCGDVGQFTVLSHQEQNLTSQESMQQILKYFTDISKEFSPLDVSTLPVRVKVKLLDRQTYTPQIKNYQVYNAIKATKKPRSTRVPGDLPKKLLNVYSV